MQRFKNSGFQGNFIFCIIIMEINYGKRILPANNQLLFLYYSLDYRRSKKIFFAGVTFNPFGPGVMTAKNLKFGPFY